MEILFSQSIHTYCKIHLLETVNTRVEKDSREMKNSSSKWILNKPIFQKLIQALGIVDVDLFASRLCHQIPK